MKKQQKPETPQNTTEPSLFLREASFTGPLLEKTNPILTPQISLQPLILQLVTTIFFKIPQKKRTQLKPIFSLHPSPDSDGGDKKRRAQATRRKASLFLGIPVFLKILFLGNKPNFPTQRITTTTCKRSTYNDLHPQNHKKSKPNPNPIKANPNPIYSTDSVAKTICKNLLPIITEEKCPLGIKANFLGLKHIFLPCEFFKIISITLYPASNYIHQFKKLTEAPTTTAKFPEKFR